MQLEIRNYYEVLLMETLRDEGLIAELSEDYLSDLCCITLNQLPVRYIRHLVDTYFFEDYNELKLMKNEIHAALERSRTFLNDAIKKEQASEAARQAELAKQAAIKAAQEAEEEKIDTNDEVAVTPNAEEVLSKVETEAEKSD